MAHHVVKVQPQFRKKIQVRDPWAVTRAAMVIAKKRKTQKLVTWLEKYD